MDPGALAINQFSKSSNGSAVARERLALFANLRGRQVLKNLLLGERYVDIGGAVARRLHQVDHMYAARISGVDVVAAVLEVRGARPIRLLEQRLIAADASDRAEGNVELVEDVEGLDHGFRRVFNRDGRAFQEGRTHEARRRREIAR